MRKHSGMRPQDIPVLFKIVTLGEEPWKFKDLASGLGISAAEISESLNRSHLAGLLDPTKRKVYRKNLMEFLQHGLHYVFPQQPGTMVTGMATAHSHPYFKSLFPSEVNYAWPAAKGNIRGLAVEPLYKAAPMAALTDKTLYLLLACTDVLRVGKTREIKMALEVLEKTIQHESAAKLSTH